MLHVKVAGEGETLVLLHGLFGSLENLGAVARFLTSNFKVYSVDLPNHGRSSHRDGADLGHMASAVSRWMNEAGLTSVGLVGHSLGGKVAMEIALSHPERVRGVVVIDIAPVTYPPRHQDVFAGLNAINPAAITHRAEAEALMAPHVTEEAVRSFLLKNLTKTDSGFEWRMNLQDIQRQYGHLIGENRPDASYAGPILFLKGGNSDYIKSDYRQAITRRFPAAQLKIVPDTGHWLHAEKPELTATLIRKFFLGSSREADKLIARADKNIQVRRRGIMPKAKIENLMTELHERFGEQQMSAEQQRLLRELQSHVHDVTDGAVKDPTPLETIQLMIDDLGENHPNVSALLRELLDTLKNIGV
jgi:Predicted hydrolases or acyltransferases (alpha/beta hydrolase superfamily)